MGTTNATRAEQLDALFSVNRDLGLSPTKPTPAGAGYTEPDGTDGYARVTATPAQWVAATVANPATKTTAELLEFPPATGHWVAEGTEFEWLLIFEVGTDNLVAYGQFQGELKAVEPTDIFEIAAGGVTFTSADQDA